MHWPGKYPERSFKVKSKTNPNIVYVVDVWGENDFVCSCLFNYYKRAECSHIKKVRQFLEKKKNKEGKKL